MKPGPAPISYRLSIGSDQIIRTHLEDIFLRLDQMDTGVDRIVIERSRDHGATWRLIAGRPARQVMALRMAA